MGFKKVEKNIINYQPPSNDSLRLVSGNTALVTVINQVVPLSGITNIGAGPGYFYKQTQNQIAEFRGLSAGTNLNIQYVYSGDTVGVNLNDNIIVNSISATTIYSGSTDLSLLLGGGGGGSFTQQYVSGSTGSQSLISISPAGTGNIAGANSVVLSKNSSGLSTYSAIISGKDNLINSGADYSFISGKNNIIYQPYAGGTFSHILGSNNKINGSYTSVIGNYNSGYTSNSFLTGKLNLNYGNYFGIYQLIYNTYGLNNLAGSRNFIKNAGLSNIHNGFNNIIQNTAYSSILNGNRNKLNYSTQAIASGNYNRIYSNSYSIAIGNTNLITTANTSSGEFNAIIGANNSSIKDTKNSAIWGGKLNGITGSSIVNTGGNVILQGDMARIHGSRSTVINGFNNFILNNCQDSTIISGQDNIISAGQNSIIFNGRYNNVVNSTGVTLINVNNITTSSSDSNLLITNKIKSVALTGGTTQMVVADSTGLLSVQAIPSGGSSSQQYVSGSTGSQSLISISPAAQSSASGQYAIALGKSNQSNTRGSAVIGGENNYIIGNGKTSGILAGKNNTIHSNYSTYASQIIIGGKDNIITGSTLNNKITSSYSSLLKNAKYSSIENSNNSIIQAYSLSNTQSSHCLIMNSSYSTASGFFSNIFGGQNNSASGTSNVVINGNQNEVLGGQNSVIINGISNEITNSNFSSTNTGFHNHINSGNYSSIVGGQYNTINSNFGTIINSNFSKLNNSASGSTIIGLNFFTASTSSTTYSDRLQLRSLTGATTRMVTADVNGLLSTQSLPSSSIWIAGSGVNSIRVDNGYTTAIGPFSLVAGKLNTVAASSNYGVVLGGVGNEISTNSTFSTILNGIEHLVRDYGTYSFIGGGRGAYIFQSTKSSIINGYVNKIYNNTINGQSIYNQIINGYQNKLIRTSHSTILGGYANTIGNGFNLYRYSNIFGGKGNTLTANYSNILGGNGIVLSDDYTTLVDRLQILNAPQTDNATLLNINTSDFKVGHTTLSGGSGIKITTALGNLTITYTGSTSSGGGGSSVINGLNTYTAGTSTVQSVNISAATLNNLTVTGITSLATLSATTIYSGSTDLSTLFEPRQTNYRQILSTNYVMTSSTATAQFSFQVNAGRFTKLKCLVYFKLITQVV